MTDKKTIVSPPVRIDLPPGEIDTAKLDALMRGNKSMSLALPLPREEPLSVMDQAHAAALACKAKGNHDYCPSDQPTTGLNLNQDFTIGGVRGTATGQPAKGGGRIRIPFGGH